jgi:hypothetical protein
MSRRKLAALAVAAAIVAGSVGLATNAVGAWRMAGGPLRFMGPDPASTGLTIPAGYPVGQKLYYGLAATADADLIIDRVTLVSASSGVRLTGAYVAAIWPGSRTTVTLDYSTSFIGAPFPGRFSDLPGEIRGYTCCEPRREILVELVFDTPGEHTITGLGVDYEAGFLHFHKVLNLSADLQSPWAWQEWPPPGVTPSNSPPSAADAS